MAQIQQKDIKQKFEMYSQLPSIPQSIVRIKKISKNPKASAADLANCILSDHHLTSRVLHMANSAFYGTYAGKVSTVTHAIMVMGFRAVQNIAISMAIYGVVNKLAKNSKFDINSFWIRSLSSGVAAKHLAHLIKQPKIAETAFIAGFMHDIGQPILAGIFPDKYGEITRLNPMSSEIYKTEQILLGINHMTAGEYIAGKWNLPDNLTKAIAKHHRINMPAKEKSENILIDIVYLADMLAYFIINDTAPDSPEYLKAIDKTQTLVDVSNESMIDLLLTCRTHVTEIAEDLKVSIKEEVDKVKQHKSDSLAIRQELDSKEIQLAFLQNTTSALMEAQTNDETLQIICEALFQGLQMGRVILFEYQVSRQTFNGKVGFGFDSQDIVQGMSFSIKDGMFEHILKTGSAISVVGEDFKMYGFKHTQDEIDLLAPRAFAIIPIKIINEVKYVLFIDAPDNEKPIDDNIFRSVVALTNQGAMTIERNLFREKLKS
ncbi:MAG: HDOD domain-containing protein [candidate division Zixibacteria bacterium]|nr:HDOD domain-containing protein [candidate division Zixibacteria bacterium]